MLTALVWTASVFDRLGKHFECRRFVGKRTHRFFERGVCRYIWLVLKFRIFATLARHTALVGSAIFKDEQR